MTPQERAERLRSVMLPNLTMGDGIDDFYRESMASAAAAGDWERLIRVATEAAGVLTVRIPDDIATDQQRDAWTLREFIAEHGTVEDTNFGDAFYVEYEIDDLRIFAEAIARRHDIPLPRLSS